MSEVARRRRMTRPRVEWRIVEVRNFPGHLGFPEVLDCPLILIPALQIYGRRRSLLRIGRAVQCEEIRQASIREAIITRGLQARKEKVIQIGREVFPLLRLISVMVAQRRVKRNLGDDRLVWSIEFLVVIAVLTTRLAETQQVRKAAVDV